MKYLYVILVIAVLLIGCGHNLEEEKEMKWLTNLYDPKRSDARSQLCLRRDETRQEAWENQQTWLKDKVIGRPKATEKHTVERLEAMGLVGIYDPS